MDPTKKELYDAKRSSGVDTSDPCISSTWAAVRADEEDTNWLLLTYQEEDKEPRKKNSAKMKVFSSGSGGLDELLSHLDDEKVFFGCVRAVVDGGTKFYSLSFIGDQLGGMKRGKASMHRPGVLNTFECHGSIMLEGLGGASRGEVLRQIAEQSGKKEEMIEL